jgi:hypothetical protein
MIADPPRPPRRLPVAVAPRRRPRDGEPPVSSAVSRGPRTWAAPALCDWAERGFGLVALGLDFIFSEYIQFLANSKICVGFIRTRKIMKQILLERF